MIAPSAEGMQLPMSIAFEIIIVFFLIGLNAVFALSEMALAASRRSRLAVLAGQGVKGAELARQLTESPQRYLPTVQVGMTLVSALTGVFGGARIASHLSALLVQFSLSPRVAEEIALAVIVVLITYFMMVFGELVPKQMALRQPEAIAAFLARPFGRLSRLAGPVVWLLGRSSELVLRALGRRATPLPAVTEEELKVLLAESAKTGILETEERNMIERVLRLADKRVRAIMTPRTEIVWLDRTDPPDAIAAALKSSPHSRFVVCDGSVDNVVGIVQAKDLLDRALDGYPLSLSPVLRQPAIVPDTVSALEALDRLKTDPIGLALVMDEYGSFEGVVTAADVLGAIIGERPETSIEAPREPTTEGAKELDGLMPADEAKAELGLPDLPAAGSYHTLAGLLLALLRRVPQVGDRIVFGGWRFEVLEMDGRRVARIRAVREPLAET